VKITDKSVAVAVTYYILVNCFLGKNIYTSAFTKTTLSAIKAKSSLDKSNV